VPVTEHSAVVPRASVPVTGHSAVVPRASVSVTEHGAVVPRASVSVTEHSADITMSVTEYRPKSISICDRTQYGNTNNVYFRHCPDTATMSVREHNVYIMKNLRQAQFDVANLLSVYIFPLSLQ
jgi:hypothetical protein